MSSTNNKTTFWDFIADSPALFLVSLATMLSAIGSSLTAVAVYGELSKLQASPIYYSLAFFLQLLPGLFAASIGVRLVRTQSWSRLMILGQLLGAASLVLPLMGIEQGKLPYLLTSEFVGSFLAGLLVPLSQSFAKRNVKDQHLRHLSHWFVWVFSAQFLFGEALGGVLLNLFSPKFYLFIDMLTYFAAALIILFVSLKYPKSFVRNSELSIEPNIVSKKWFALWSSFSISKKRAFLINPLLALCCAPVMSLLVSIGDSKGKSISAMGLVLTPAVLILVFKTTGQIIGPIVSKIDFIHKTKHQKWILFSLIAIYLTNYGLAASTPSFWAAAVYITLAHAASNVVYTLGYENFMREFSEQEMPQVSSKHYQFTTGFMLLSSLIAGALAEWIGIQAVILYSFVWAIVFIFLPSQSSKESL